MLKSERLYKIFITSMIVLIAGLLLATGIIALKNSMRMKIGVEMYPNFKIEVCINEVDNVVFRNFDDLVTNNGISGLSGNTLTMDNSFFDTYEKSFVVIIKNYTTDGAFQVGASADVYVDGVHEGVEPNITENKKSAIYYANSYADYASFNIDVTTFYPQTTTLQFVLTKCETYEVSVSVAEGSSANLTYTATAYPLATSFDDYSININATPNIGCILGDVTITSGETTLVAGDDYVWDSSTGMLTIYAGAILGDVNIQISAAKIPYYINVTATNATVSNVTINGTLWPDATQYTAYYGDIITFTVSYTQTNNRSLTVRDDEGNTIDYSTAEDEHQFTMPASNVKLTASCITPDSLITLANGTQRRVDELSGREELLVWNLETGAFDSAPIMFIDSELEAEYNVIKLKFEDKTEVKIIDEHGFWDYDLNKYVYIRENNASEFIGHTFAKHNANTLKKVKLIDVEIEKTLTTAWSPVTVQHLCYFVNGMLSMPGGVSGLFNIFDVIPETMAYDYEAMQKDIDEYGLFTYEEMNAICPLTEEMFEAAGGKYLKVSIGKGLMTLNHLKYMINRYSIYV